MAMSAQRKHRSILIAVVSLALASAVYAEENVERRDAMKNKNYQWQRMPSKPMSKPKNHPMYHPMNQPMYQPKYKAMSNSKKNAFKKMSGKMSGESSMGAPRVYYNSKGKGKSYSNGKGYSKGKGYPKATIPSKGIWNRFAKGKGKGKGIDCSTCSAACIGVQSFVLVDADVDEPLLTIEPNEVLDLASLEAMFGATEFAIECVTFGQVVSTRLEDNFGTTNIDNTLPWTLSGDGDGDYFPTPLPDNPGLWSVTCQPFCDLGARGESGPESSISFTVVKPGPTAQPTFAPSRAPTTSRPTSSPIADTSTPTTTPIAATSTPTLSPTPDCSVCSNACLKVVDFLLVDANKDGEDGHLQSVKNDNVLDLSNLQAQYGTSDFTIICITSPEPFAATPFEIGSAGLRDNFNTNNDPGEFQIENNPPYTLADDDSSDYRITPFADNLGQWTVDCQAFCDLNLQGLSSDLVSISFTVQA